MVKKLLLSKSIIIFFSISFSLSLSNCHLDVSSPSGVLVSQNQPHQIDENNSNLYKETNHSGYLKHLKFFKKNIPGGIWKKDDNNYSVQMQKTSRSNFLFSVHIKNRENSSWGFLFEFFDFDNVNDGAGPIIKAIPNDRNQPPLLIYYSDSKDSGQGSQIRTAAGTLVKAAEILSLPHLSALVDHFTRSFSVSNKDLRVDQAALRLIVEEYTGKLKNSASNKKCTLFLRKNRFGDIVSFLFLDEDSLAAKNFAISAIFPIPYLWVDRNPGCYRLTGAPDPFETTPHGQKAWESRDIDDRGQKDSDVLGNDVHDFTLKHSIKYVGASPKGLGSCSTNDYLQFCNNVVQYKSKRTFTYSFFGLANRLHHTKIDIECEAMELMKVKDTLLNESH